MGKDTKIEWAHHTFNPWWGCFKIAPECANCYAETFDHRMGGNHWGPGTARKLASDKVWAEPLKWDHAAQQAGVRQRVFCASMADVFEDHPALNHERGSLWMLIENCPNLDWLLLTKRPENIRRMVPPAWLNEPRENVWYGTSAGTQASADKNIPELLKVPAAMRFVSAEPLLEEVNFDKYDKELGTHWLTGLDENYPEEGVGSCLDWIIVGGESGAHARPMNSEWVKSLQLQCQTSNVPFFFKQWGEWFPREEWQHNPELFLPDDSILGVTGGVMRWGNGRFSHRVGKVRAGRLLDGREWNEIPT